jgi:hypothetical protein
MKRKEQTFASRSTGNFQHLGIVNVVNDRLCRMRMLIWQLTMKKVSMTAGPLQDPFDIPGTCCQ